MATSTVSSSSKTTMTITKTIKKRSPLWIPFWIALTGLWTFLSVDWYVCVIRQECRPALAAAPATTMPVQKVIPPPAKVIEKFERIYFKKNQSDIFLTNSLESAYSEIGIMNTDGANKEFHITGYYFTGEAESIGLDRAESIKQRFTDYPWFDQIRTKAQLISKEFPLTKYDTYAHASEFNIVDTKDKYRVERKTIYFATNAADPQASNNIKLYLKGVAESFKRGTIDKVHVVGHTDNQGKAENNYQLASNRALMIKQMLVDFGMDADKVTTESQGEAQPAATNDTREGRQLNRRVVLDY